MKARRSRAAIGLLLLLCLLAVASAPAWAAPVSGASGVSEDLTAQVLGTAFAFMAPRTLEPVSMPQLAQWGLQGLTAIDPQLVTTPRDDALAVSLGDRLIAAVPPPPVGDPAAWGAAVARLAARAADVSEPLRHAGTEGVIRSVFDELFNHFDPYSRYDPPQEATDDRDRRSGMAGAGIEIAARGRAILVSAVLSEGPAAAAGIRAGERLVAVDGRAVEGIEEAREAIAGPDGSALTLTLRGRDGRLRGVDLVRAAVPPETVFSSRQGELLVLRISGFARRTDQRVAHAIVQGLAGPARPRALVLDLRGNRGGLVKEAAAVVGTMLGTGLVATTAGRDPEADRVWRADGNDLSNGLPILVMVDGRSASAAEIVAAALADNGRAVVLGSVTLGKGLVQTIAPLPDGGELFITWSRVLAPLGWPIQGLGVMPQLCTSLGEAVLDRQLATLAAGERPMAGPDAAYRRARAPLPVAQILDMRAACPAALGSDRDLAAAKALAGNPVAYRAALLTGFAATP